jgi:hypothetical protein
MQTFGWRIPFLCASLTSALGYFMRRGLPEPAAVAEVRARHLNAAHYQGRAQAQGQAAEEEQQQGQHDGEGSRGSKALSRQSTTELDPELEVDPDYHEYRADAERGRWILGPKAVPLVSDG